MNSPDAADARWPSRVRSLVARVRALRPLVVEGNHIALLVNGDDYFPALLAAIESARRSVHIETYILADDKIGGRAERRAAHLPPRALVAAGAQAAAAAAPQAGGGRRPHRLHRRHQPHRRLDRGAGPGQRSRRPALRLRGAMRRADRGRRGAGDAAAVVDGGADAVGRAARAARCAGPGAANAYFLPGRRFRTALREAVARGVRVRLLLQGRVEYPIQHHAQRAMYGDLLGAGLEIHEYQASFLHAKVAVVDESWATVGSSNIDPYSLLLAREANIGVYDARFAARLRAVLESALENDSVALRAADFARRGVLVRVLDWAAYAAVRAATTVLARAPNY
ncbi:MAG: phospholipase D-like domain-containing protein [Burkholderiaceae bacterium]|nr:phospholipase D-like domain-containing protein [Burkholderiaceae bacterium]